MIDTHTHIFESDFDKDIDQVIQRALDNGVDKMLMPNINKDTVAAMLNLADKYPNNCLPMIGIHPCDVKEDYLAQLTLLKSCLERRKFYGIGEIGLDYYHDLTFKTQQIDAFKQQIEWALAYDLAISIHSRNATQDAIDIVSEYQNGKLRGVFHCFEGTVEQAEMVKDLGFCVGIGGVVTFKNTNLREIAKQIDIAQIVLETDAPFLAPVPFRGKRNESSYIPLIAQVIADVKEMSLQSLETITDANAKRIFNL